MKKMLSILFVLTVILTACNQKNNYYYVEIVEEQGLFGRPSEIKEQERRTIKAENDTAAYIEAYKLFAISQKVKINMERDGFETSKTPINFKLINKDGRNIAAIEFKSKAALEAAIYEDIVGSFIDTHATKEVIKVDGVKYIRGLSPVDIYMNLEKQGFKTTKHFNKEWGNTWTSTKSYSGISYEVVAYSTSADNVESVSATAIIDVLQKDIISTQQFFSYISSLPYTNSNPQQASKWVIDNFNKNNSSVAIGDATFTIFAPSKATRTLTIEKTK